MLGVFPGLLDFVGRLVVGGKVLRLWQSDFEADESVIVDRRPVDRNA